jgi:fermentation-respiration switch protein FrsA (DUF1100 family)
MKLRPVNPIEARLVFPGINTQGRSDAIAWPREDCNLITLTASDGTSLTGLYGPGVGTPARGLTRATILFFYGTGTCLAHNVHLFAAFRELGFNAMMVDYPGYGMSKGRPSEAGCYAAADLAYEYLMARGDLANIPIIAVGWSLGAAIAIDLAFRKPVAGLITLSAFTAIGEMARVVTRGVPLGFLLKSRFNNLAKLPKVACPILMLHGTMDRIVPVKMLDKLANVARSQLTVFRVEGRDHNDLFEYAGEEIYQRIRSFVASVAGHVRQ